MFNFMCRWLLLIRAHLNHHSFIINSHTVIWLICAFIGGFIFRLGAYYSNNKETILKQFSQNLLPAVFLSEGVNKLIHLNDYNHMIPALLLLVIIGVLLYFVINRKNALKRSTIVTFIILSFLGIIFYEILYKVS